MVFPILDPKNFGIITALVDTLVAVSSPFDPNKSNLSSIFYEELFMDSGMLTNFTNERDESLCPLH